MDCRPACCWKGGFVCVALTLTVCGTDCKRSAVPFAGEERAFAGSGEALVESQVRGEAWLPRMAMDADKRREAAMARTASDTRVKSSWMMWAFWAAGVSLLLVELQAGMEYLEAGLERNMSGMLGCLPAMGMITLNFAEHSVWHWSAMQGALQSVPLVALGLLLVFASVMLSRHGHRAGNPRGSERKQGNQ